MCARLCLCKVKYRAVLDNALLMRNIVIKHLRERKHLRLAVHDGKHIDGAGVLQLRVFVELIEYDLAVRVAPVVEYYLYRPLV